jgi:cytochrome-b5 reductase
MYQLICRILENPKDQTRIWLVYGNRTEQDILLKAELDDLQKKHGDRLRVKYVLDHPPENWTGGQGFINQGMIEEMLGDEKIRRKVFVCGPNKMLRLVCGERARDYSQGQVTGILARLGLSSKEIWKFQ